MALILSDGLDSYGATADLYKGGWMTEGAFNGSAGRFGGGAIVGTGTQDTRIQFPRAGAAPQALIIGFTFKINASPSSDWVWCFVPDETAFILTTNSYFGFDSSGRLTFWRSGAKLFTGTTNVCDNQFHRLEFLLDVDDGVNGRISAKIDGNTEIEDLTADTKGGGTATIGGLHFDGRATHTYTLDDLTVCDESGGAPFNTFLGDLKIDTLRPDGDDATTDWTPDSGGTNYTQVDESDADEDTSYVETATVNNEDLYDHAAFATQPETVLGVVVTAHARQVGVGRGIKMSAKSSATTARSAELTPGRAYTRLQAVFENDPNTAAAWDAAGIEAAKFGYQLST